MFLWLSEMLDDLRTDRAARRAMRDLACMDEMTLKDVGIERDLIETVARGMARRPVPAPRRRVPDRVRIPLGSRPVHCG